MKWWWLGVALWLTAMPASVEAQDHADSEGLPDCEAQCPPPTYVPPPNRYARPGFYVGLSGAIGGEAFGDLVTDTIASIGLPTTVDSSAGLNARVGYRWKSWLAIEAQYEWMSRFQFRLGRINAAELGMHTWVVSPKVFVPYKNIQPYILFGIGGQLSVIDAPPRFVADRTDFNFAMRPGVGLDYSMAENWVLNAEFAGVLPIADTQTGLVQVDQLFYVSGSLGLQYRF